MPAETKAPSRGWRVFAAVLVVVFGAAAAWQAQQLGTTLVAVWQARGWQPVTARLVSWQRLDLGRMVIRHWAGIVPMQALAARYDYVIDGRAHVGSQAALDPLRDNFSDRDRDRIAAQLRAADADSGRLRIWVDPQHPDRAVIDRRLPVAACAFRAFVLLLPCGLATLVVLATVLRWIGAGRWALPLWAVLHGSVALPIALLAAPGDLTAGPSAILLLLAAVAAAGVVGLVRRARRSGEHRG